MHLPARRLLLASTALAALAAVGCAHAQTVTGSGRIVSEARAVSGFEAVQLEASMKLVVRQAAAEAVQVRGDDNLLPLLETLVEQRRGEPTLVVRWKRSANIRHAGEIVVSVDAVRLKALAASGSGSIEAAAFKTPSMRLSVAGSGDIRVPALEAADVDASIAGSGDVKVGGKAQRVKVSIAGSGDADLGALEADDVAVSIAGSGDANVTAASALSVSIAGSGDVRYGGAVTAVKSRIVGSGDVRRR